MAWEHINTKFVQRYCSIPGCSNKYKANNLCGKHLQQKVKFGYAPVFSFRDPNPVTIKGDKAYITIFKGHTCEIETKSIIDAEDAERVAKYKWHFTNGYIKSNRWPLASFLMGGKPWIDHINGNRLDNRKSNLRPVNDQQNAQNMGVWKKPKSSKYKGVSRDINLKIKPWKSKIKTGGIQYNIGRYETQEEAAWMYDQFALEMFGEYARTNFHYQNLSPIQIQ